MMRRKKQYSLSLVIPVFNEQDNIDPLVKKIIASLKKIPLKEVEIIFIDDGSTDNTFAKLVEHQKYTKFVKIVKLRTNSGKATAYSVGFFSAKNEVIITLDGDLQDDPAEIQLFLDKLDEGYDMVTGWKVKGKGTIVKTQLSRFFNFIVSVAFQLRLHDFNCPFKAYKREALIGLRVYSGLYRYIPVFAKNYGFRVAEIKISNSPRKFGKSKYGGKRILTGFFDFITSFFLIRFNMRPMYMFGSLALINMTVGTGILAYLTWLSFQGQAVGSRPFFSLGILLEIMSLQFFSIGFIAELFTRNVVNVDTQYLIDKTA